MTRSTPHTGGRGGEVARTLHCAVITPRKLVQRNVKRRYSMCSTAFHGRTLILPRCVSRATHHTICGGTPGRTAKDSVSTPAIRLRKSRQRETHMLEPESALPLLPPLPPLPATCCCAHDSSDTSNRQPQIKTTTKKNGEAPTDAARGVPLRSGNSSSSRNTAFGRSWHGTARNNRP